MADPAIDHLPVVRIYSDTSSRNDQIGLSYEVGGSLYEKKVAIPDELRMAVPRFGRRHEQTVLEFEALKQTFGRILWHDCLDGTLDEGRYLRLRLWAESTELGAWPWEIANSERNFHRLLVLRVLADGGLVTNYSPVAQRPSMLYAFNSPFTTRQWSDPNNPGERWNLQPLGDESDIVGTLEAGYAVRSTNEVLGPQVLRDALQGIDVLHITCHGVTSTSGPQLVMFDGERSFTVTGGDLGSSISQAQKRHGTDLRLVTIAACWSASEATGSFLSLAEQVFAAGVPMVIAMARPLDEASGRNLLRSFYPALLTSSPVEALEATAGQLLSDDHLTLRVYVAPFAGHLFGRPLVQPLDDRPLLEVALWPVLQTAAGDRLVDRIDGELPSLDAVVPGGDIATDIMRISPSGRLMARQLRGGGVVEMAWVDRVEGRMRSWIALNVGEDRVLAISDELFPGSGIVSVIVAGTEGCTRLLTFRSVDVVFEEIISESGAHAVADRDGYLLITSAGGVESVGSPGLGEIGRRLSPIADEVSHVDLCGDGDYAAVLVALRSGALRVITPTGTHDLGTGSYARLVRSSGGCAVRRVVVRDLDGTLRVQSW